MEALPMIRRAFGEENISHTQEIEWHTQFMADQKSRETSEKQSQVQAHNFL
jgi:hypothetical protein